MDPIRETVYDNRDNSIDLLLKADDVAQSLAAVDRMTLRLLDSDGVLVATVDSDQDSGVFDWNTGTTGKVIIALGAKGLTAGEYWARLTVFDPGNTDGIVWGDFILTIKAEPA